MNIRALLPLIPSVTASAAISSLDTIELALPQAYTMSDDEASPQPESIWESRLVEADAMDADMSIVLNNITRLRYADDVRCRIVYRTFNDSNIYWCAVRRYLENIKYGFLRNVDPASLESGWLAQLRPELSSRCQ
jgi:hypothetical protein